MLITKVKPREELDHLLARDPLIVKCFGCREVLFPEDEIDERLLGVPQGRIVRVDYLCREEFSAAYLKSFPSAADRAGAIVVFSCGVGVQVMAKLAPDRPVHAGCDTCYLYGFQGLAIQGYNCDSCGECRLNDTGGICPITACAKGLLNGACGGAKNGMCEVNPQMPCGWERIYKRLAAIGAARNMGAQETRVRNYQRVIRGETGEPG